MGPTKFIAPGVAAIVVGGAALSAGAVPAQADPDWGGGESDEWVDKDWRDWRDRDWNAERDRGAENWNDGDWHKWWRVNKWRNDDRPPWGWGPPPAVHWRGHPPHWIDYWGLRVFPVWNPHFNVFGFWLHGIFIPVFII